MVCTKISKTRARLLASVVIAGLASACSSDLSRFNDPFANPFHSRAAFDPSTTASIKKTRQNTQAPLANIRNTTATTQPLPAPSQPMLTAAAAAPAVPSATKSVMSTGSVASANYPALAPVAADFQAGSAISPSSPLLALARQ